jgi:hypothetical protein
MSIEKYNYKDLIEEMIKNQKNYGANKDDAIKEIIKNKIHDLNIEIIIANCKYELKSWHHDKFIGSTLCMRNLIEFLSLLYSRAGDNAINYDNSLAPMNIFRILFFNYIKDFMYLNDDDRALKLLRYELYQGYFTENETQLNKKLRENIESSYKGWDSL